MKCIICIAFSFIIKITIICNYIVIIVELILSRIIAIVSRSRKLYLYTYYIYCFKYFYFYRRIFIASSRDKRDRDSSLLDLASCFILRRIDAARQPLIEHLPNKV